MKFNKNSHFSCGLSSDIINNNQIIHIIISRHSRFYYQKNSLQDNIKIIQEEN